VSSFPDVEAGFLDLLAVLAPGSNETPPDLDRRLAVAGVAGWFRVRRIGGQDDGVTDFSQVDVDVFATSRDRAFSLARAARELLTDGPPPLVAGCILDRVTTVVAPVEVPNENPRVTRYLGSYRATARRQ
jgi:hypothetical protein